VVIYIKRKRISLNGNIMTRAGKQVGIKGRNSLETSLTHSYNCGKNTTTHYKKKYNINEF